jgi:hypothetical protein
MVIELGNVELYFVLKFLTIMHLMSREYVLIRVFDGTSIIFVGMFLFLFVVLLMRGYRT